jgi:hypothetical protein
METQTRSTRRLFAPPAAVASQQFAFCGARLGRPDRAAFRIVLTSVADLVEELRTGTPSSRLDSPVFTQPVKNRGAGKLGWRHQTDDAAVQKPRPRPAMTR